MLDHEDGDVPWQLAHHGEDPLPLAGRKPCARLVQEQHLGARRQGEPSPAARGRQPSLFGLLEPDVEQRGSDEERSVLEELARQEPERLTPLDALSLLAEWKRRLQRDASREGEG